MLKSARIIFFLATFILTLEIILLIFMPESSHEHSIDPNAEKSMEYAPYMFGMMTLSFLAGLTLVIGSIIWILKGNLKNEMINIGLLTLDFLLPILVYYFFI